MQAIVYKDDLGQEFETTEIPAELGEQAHEYHHQLIDAISHFDDEVLEAYIEDESSVTPDMIKRALRAGTLADEITPVLLGSAFKNKGVQLLLDAVIDYLPSPLDVPPVHGVDPKNGSDEERPADPKAPFSALAFKVMSDPYVGKLTYFRVYSGTLKAGDRVLNTTTGRTERIGRILQMHANHREEREEIMVDRLKREFNVDANVGRPQVAYRETISKPAERVQGKFVRQTGGSGQYGDAVINLYPQKPGAGYEFVDKIVGGKIPREYIPAINAGIQEAMGSGILAGYPVVDVKVELIEGSYHDVDSSE